MNLEDLDWVTNDDTNSGDRRVSHYMKRGAEIPGPHTILESRNGIYTICANVKLGGGPGTGKWENLCPLAAQAIIYHLLETHDASKTQDPS